MLRYIFLVNYYELQGGHCATLTTSQQRFSRRRLHVLWMGTQHARQKNTCTLLWPSARARIILSIQRIQNVVYPPISPPFIHFCQDIFAGPYWFVTDNQGPITRVQDGLTYAELHPNSTLAPDWDVPNEIVQSLTALSIKTKLTTSNNTKTTKLHMKT